MKKIFAALLIAVMGIGVANAGLRFGVKAGATVDHMSTNLGKIMKNNKPGWTAGVMGEFEVPIIGLCFDLSVMYARLNNEGNADFNKDFILIPLNLKYKFKLPVVGSFLAPYIFTGPSFDFNLNKKIINDFKYKTFQAVWNVGLGFELVKHLQIGASYGFGMNNIAKTLVPEIIPVKMHNNYWTITAAWLF